jgi:hypothetical protein
MAKERTLPMGAALAAEKSRCRRVAAAEAHCIEKRVSGLGRLKGPFLEKKASRRSDSLLSGNCRGSGLRSGSPIPRFRCAG